jgi:transposase
MDESLRHKIIYLRDVMNLNFRQIGEKIGISRKRVSRMYRDTEKRSTRLSSLDRYRSLLADWFCQYPTLKAIQAYSWLSERGIKISYSRVVQYSREFRKKKAKAYHHLSFLPGEEGQVDWAIIIHPSLGKLYCFVLVLSYSRYLFAHLFPRSSFEFFIEGHLKAFDAFHGLPRNLRYDNLKSVVIKRNPQIEYNPRFLEFCRHYGITICVCNVAAGNEKGRVERAIRALRETFFNTAAHYTSLDTLNTSLYKWVNEKNNTVHRSTQQKPVDLFKEEGLKVLPNIPWNNINIFPPAKTTKTAMMIFDNNSYSVPDYLVGNSFSVQASTTKVDIYSGDKKIASHPRSFERNKQIINPLHRTYQRLSTKAKNQRIFEVIKAMHPVISQFLLVNQEMGEDNYKTAYYLFKLLKNHSRMTIVSAVNECLTRKSPRLKTLLSYLNHNQEDVSETVYPQHSELLQITYKPRSLEDYDK